MERILSWRLLSIGYLLSSNVARCRLLSCWNTYIWGEWMKTRIYLFWIDIYIFVNSEVSSARSLRIGHNFSLLLINYSLRQPQLIINNVITEYARCSLCRWRKNSLAFRAFLSVTTLCWLVVLIHRFRKQFYIVYQRWILHYGPVIELLKVELQRINILLIFSIPIVPYMSWALFVMKNVPWCSHYSDGNSTISRTIFQILRWWWRH